MTDGGEHREIIVDANDITLEDGETNESYRSKLYARGIEKLLEHTKTFLCKFEPYSNDFGVKYDLGDILKIYLTDYGITLKARVSEFSQKSQRNKTTTTIKVGDITIKR